jgi:hypothetical protein
MRFIRSSLAYLTIAALLLVIAPTIGHAGGAGLAVSPGLVKTNAGQSFSVTIQVNANEAINAASGTVSFPDNILSATSISQGGSIFTLWTVSPTVAGNTIPFGGGLASPGFSGSGKLFTINFKAKGNGSGTISISGGQVLANDGHGTNVYTGASSSSITVAPNLSGATISSSSHPDQNKWYKGRNVSLSWSKPSGVASFNYTFGKSGSTPLKSGSTSSNSLSISDVADGSWTFSLTAIFSGDQKQSSFRVQIDNVAPEKFDVKVTQASSTDPFPVLTYEATDALSGIDHYEITVDKDDPISTSEKTLKLPKQRPGKHHVTVKAVDKAGNSTEATAEFTLEGFPGPVITDISRFVAVLQPVQLTGTALYGTTIHLFVDDKQAAEFTVKENLSDHQRQTADRDLKDDQNVEWSYYYKGSLLPGKHSFYAIQIKADTSESNPSNTVSSTVLWSSISLFGIIIPLAIVSLVLVVIVFFLIIFFLALLRRRRRDKQGSAPAGDGGKAVKKKISQKLGELEKDISKNLSQLEDKPKNLRSQIISDIEATKRELEGKAKSDEDKPEDKK